MNDERVKSIVERAQARLGQEIKTAGERRMYGEVNLRMTFENGVPQVLSIGKTETHKS